MTRYILDIRYGFVFITFDMNTVRHRPKHFTALEVTKITL